MQSGADCTVIRVELFHHTLNAFAKSSLVKVDAKDILSDNILQYDKDTKTLETIPSEMTREAKDQERVC